MKCFESPTLREGIPTVVLALLTAAAPGAAQEGHDHGSQGSPYADLQDREIKALSAEDVESLRNGEGMGFALPAELNGYPGPKHVLEMSGELDLTPEQTGRLETIVREMNREARRLGRELIEAERSLDESFAGESVSPEELRGLVERAASLRGELRLAHLEAHLGTAEVLDRHQVHRYQTLRGYGEPHEHGGGGYEGRR